MKDDSLIFSKFNVKYMLINLGKNINHLRLELINYLLILLLQIFFLLLIVSLVEDVHSQVEFMLTSKLGDVGKKVHTGRSRNDQVLVDLKLFARAELV